jgi:hypothetical protein
MTKLARRRPRLLLLAALLLTLASAAGPGLARSAPARAAVTPAAAQAAPANPDLEVAFTQGGTAVIPGVSVTVAGTYSCNDALGAHNVPITVTLTQGTGTAEGSTTVACQKRNAPFRVLVLFPLVKGGTEIGADAAITNDTFQATDSASLVTHSMFISTDPSYTVDTRTDALHVSGHYGCTDTGTAAVQISAVQTRSDGTVVTGSSVVSTICPATSKSFTVTIFPNSYKTPWTTATIAATTGSVSLPGTIGYKSPFVTISGFECGVSACGGYEP